MKRLNIAILVCNSLVLLLTVARLLAVDNIYYQLTILVLVAILLIVSMVLTAGVISILRREKKCAPIVVMTDAFRNALRDCTAPQGESEKFAEKSETLTWSKWRQVSPDDPRLRKRTEISQDILGNVIETERFELDVSEDDDVCQ